MDELEIYLLRVTGIDEIHVLAAGYAPKALNALLAEEFGNIRGDSLARRL